MPEYLELIDKKSRKLLKMHGGLHPRSNVGRLYILMILAERRSIYLGPYEKRSALSWQIYISHSSERLLEPAEYNNINKDKERCMVNLSERYTNIKRWKWLQKGELKKETRNLACATKLSIL